MKLLYIVDEMKGDPEARPGVKKETFTPKPVTKPAAVKTKAKVKVTVPTKVAVAVEEGMNDMAADEEVDSEFDNKTEYDPDAFAEWEDTPDDDWSADFIY